MQETRIIMFRLLCTCRQLVYPESPLRCQQKFTLLTVRKVKDLLAPLCSLNNMQVETQMMKLLHLLLSLTSAYRASAFKIVLAGGTGELGRALSSSLVHDGHDVTILCRNSFLAAAPSRVTSEFGWLGKSFLDKHPSIKLRDWDGGDLLDIVGQDWVGWQVSDLHRRSVPFLLDHAVLFIVRYLIKVSYRYLFNKFNILIGRYTFQGRCSSQSRGRVYATT